LLTNQERKRFYKIKEERQKVRIKHNNPRMSWYNSYSMGIYNESGIKNWNNSDLAANHENVREVERSTTHS
jgi:hypothetical protein